MLDTRTLPIRMRLALWYTASFFFVFVFFGVGMFYSMQASIQRDFDRDLDTRLAGIEEFLVEEDGQSIENIRHELQENSELRPGGELLQIANARGNWIYRSESMRHLSVPAPARDSPASRSFSTVSAHGVPLRLVTASKTVRDHLYRIQIAQSQEESSKVIRHFAWILGAAIPLLLLAASAIGYWLAKRALQPIIAITDDARSITSLDISNRIALPLAKDELHDLSRTLNAMLDRLESAFRRVTQFTADASHELRTPVALIRTTAELALADRSPQAHQEALSSILQESERTTDLLEDLLAVARSDSGVRLRMEPLDGVALAQHSASHASLLASSRNVRFRFVPDVQPCVIPGNSELLRRLFLILIDNAVKYTHPGGLVVFRILRRDSSMIAEITDTGVGISPEDLPHIFERFYRADKARDRSGGAGLGLSIAEWIVNVHRARIFVSSVLGQGTKVIVSFPIQKPGAPPEPTIKSHLSVHESEPV